MAEDKSQLVLKFRERLSDILQHKGLSQSAFCRLARLDRSTLNQLLSSERPRLPRADTIIAIAGALQVSTDWLLGLSQQEERGTDILELEQQIARAAPSPVDGMFQSWFEAASGQKIRYVPRALPDQLRIEELSTWEYEHYPQRSPEQAIDMTLFQLELIQNGDIDFEVCSPVCTLECMALGQGQWSGIDRNTRIEQLETMIQLTRDLYPAYRWYLYDNRTAHSSPITIFGSSRATIYIGNMYFVCNSNDHVRALTRHFDNLIRRASVQPNEISNYLEKLLLHV